MALTHGQRNRMIRKEALREQLRAQGHVQYCTELLGKMAELADGAMSQEDKDRFSALATLFDKHMRLVDKYVPNLKPIDLVVEHSPGIEQSADTVAWLLQHLGEVTQAPPTN